MANSSERLGDGPVEAQGQAVVSRQPCLGLGQLGGPEPALVLVEMIEVVRLEPAAKTGREPLGEKETIADVRGELKINDPGTAVIARNNITPFVQIEMDDVAGVDSPQRVREAVEEIGGQQRPVVQRQPLNVLIDVGVRIEAGQDARDLRDPLATPELADFAAGHEPAEQAERQETEVHPPVDLANKASRKFEV